jgi:hypothetical protein
MILSNPSKIEVKIIGSSTLNKKAHSVFHKQKLGYTVAWIDKEVDTNYTIKNSSSTQPPTLQFIYQQGNSSTLRCNPKREHVINSLMHSAIRWEK